MLKQQGKRPPYKDAQEAVNALYEELGTWERVSVYLSSNGRYVYEALVWNAAKRGDSPRAVVAALVERGLIAPVPEVVAVEVCMKCNSLHKQQATCPSLKRVDTRKTRAWHGTKEEARELDRRLSGLGFKNLQEFTDEVLENRSLLQHLKDYLL